MYIAVWARILDKEKITNDDVLKSVPFFYRKLIILKNLILKVVENGQRLK